MEETNLRVQRASVSRLLRGSIEACVLVVGDVMLDEYLSGPVERVSPEAPVPVLSVDDEHCVPGGAAHVARVLAALGASALLVGVIGEDPAGERLRAACGEVGIEPTGLVTDHSRATTRKTRVMCGPQQMVRIDREDDRPVSAPIRSEVLDRVAERIHQVDAVVVSDYAKGLLGDVVLSELVSMATERGVPVLVDPKHHDLSRYRGATVLKMNIEELTESISPRTPRCEVRSRLPELIGRVHSSSAAPLVVVTLGADGVVVSERDSEPVWIAGSAQDVYDVTGAGDVVAAVFTLALVGGLEAVEAAMVSNLAAGISVRHLGARPVLPGELLQACAPPGSPEALFDVHELSLVCRQWREAGEQIVFTNGCFDLLHAGHLQLLTQAARLGDRLVVAVDRDASVWRLKGPGRPVLDEKARTSLLGALDVVDAVVVFDDDLLDVIDHVGPDVIVKGADYRGREVVGASLVKSRGGRIELVPLLEGYSTTGLVERVRAGEGERPGAVGL